MLDSLFQIIQTRILLSQYKLGSLSFDSFLFISHSIDVNDNPIKSLISCPEDYLAKYLLFHCRFCLSFIKALNFNMHFGPIFYHQLVSLLLVPIFNIPNQTQQRIISKISKLTDPIHIALSLLFLFLFQWVLFIKLLAKNNITLEAYPGDAVAPDILSDRQNSLQLFRFQGCHFGRRSVELKLVSIVLCAFYLLHQFVSQTALQGGGKVPVVLLCNGLEKIDIDAIEPGVEVESEEGVDFGESYKSAAPQVIRVDEWQIEQLAGLLQAHWQAEGWYNYVWIISILQMPYLQQIMKCNTKKGVLNHAHLKALTAVCSSFFLMVNS